MRVVRRFVIGFALTAMGLAWAATGCTLLTSLDGFSGGDDPSSLDGSDDRALESFAEDALVRGETSAAKNDAGEAGYNGFCESETPAPVFCSDFENPAGPATLPAAWDSIAKFGAAGVFVDTSSAISKPASLLATFTMGTNQGGAGLVKTFDAPIKNDLQLDFDMRIEEHDGSQALLMTLELFTIAGKKDALQLRYRNAGGMDFAESADQPGDGGTLYAGTSLVATKTGVWVHVRVQVAQVMNGATATLSVDGMSASSPNFRAYRYASPPKLTLGMVYLPSSTSAWHVRYDNVVVTAN